MFRNPQYILCRKSTALSRVGSRFRSSRSMETPPWLQAVANDATPAPKLFAWSPANLGYRSTIQGSCNDSTIDRARRIHILGVGNIGILFATSLSQLSDGPPITLVVHKRELLEIWARDPGLLITRDGNTDRMSDFDVEWWTDQEPSKGPKRQVGDGHPIRHLLVSTKSSAALAEVDRLRGYLDSNSSVAFAQNGMCKLWQPYGEHYISLRYPQGDQPAWLACVITHGVTSLGRFRSEHVSVANVKIGPVYIGQSDTPISYLAEMLRRAPFLNGEQVTLKQLWILQLEKLVVNSIINPLTAILGCKNGRLFETPEGPLMQVVEALVDEASGVLQVLVQHQCTGDIMASAEDHSHLAFRFSTRQLKLMLVDIGHRVKDNTSSMLQDYRAGRPTEIQDFNGWLVDMAAFLGVQSLTARHQALIHLVEKGIRMDEKSLWGHLMKR